MPCRLYLFTDCKYSSYNDCHFSWRGNILSICSQISPQTFSKQMWLHLEGLGPHWAQVPTPRGKPYIWADTGILGAGWHVAWLKWCSGAAWGLVTLLMLGRGSAQLKCLLQVDRSRSPVWHYARLCVACLVDGIADYSYDAGQPTCRHTKGVHDATHRASREVRAVPGRWGQSAYWSAQPEQRKERDRATDFC